MSDRRLRNTKWGRTGSYQSYDDVKAFFDVWANKPDKDIEGSISYEADLTDCYYGPAMISELLLSELKNGPKRILDFGCGTGLAGSPR